jgi:hypothetical protein
MISAYPADPAGLGQGRTQFGPQMRCGEHDSPVREPDPELLEGVCGSQVQIDVRLGVQDEPVRGWIRFIDRTGARATRSVALGEEERRVVSIKAIAAAMPQSTPSATAASAVARARPISRRRNFAIQSRASHCRRYERHQGLSWTSGGAAADRVVGLDDTPTARAALRWARGRPGSPVPPYARCT